VDPLEAAMISKRGGEVVGVLGKGGEGAVRRPLSWPPHDWTSDMKRGLHPPSARSHTATGGNTHTAALSLGPPRLERDRECSEDL
jgi:hypothetical protein